MAFPAVQLGVPLYSKNMMTSERCAQIILRAADRRQREVLLGPGRLVAWLKLLTPGLLDRIVINFLKATVRRKQENVQRSLSQARTVNLRRLVYPRLLIIICPAYLKRCSLRSISGRRSRSARMP